MAAANPIVTAIPKQKGIDISWKSRLPHAPKLETSLVEASKKFIDACKKGDRATAEEALSEGADKNATGEFDRCGLIWAIINRHEDFAMWLMAYKRVDVNSKDCTGNDALSYCADLNMELAATTAISHGGDVFSKNNVGFTAEMRARTRGYKRMEDMLKGNAVYRNVTEGQM
ncbi:Putative ankyrin repeat protein [Candidatus Anstonella stagnisolia]|nr:Putative ankyrin repeat protein [Candidatus Anstonella stagnisolia]